MTRTCSRRFIRWALLVLALSPWGGLLRAQVKEPPPDQWPILLPCREASDPKSCTDSLLQVSLRRSLSASMTGGGLVVTAFVIDTEGALGDIEILRGADAAGEAVREALGALPGWVPAIREGVPVSVRLELPLRFVHPEGLEELYSLSWGDADTRLLEKKRLRGLSRAPLVVRDADGHLLEPVQVTWTCRRGEKVRRHRGHARDDVRLAAWLRRCPRGATLEVEARIVRETTFVPVRKQWLLH